ncbi:hypothetical protein E2C01_075053 [Portunus trituberculatus]|uniref:Uncharacterized protein n=1 Tax=Portunus trituberculatus TaxID=210409 RepID=A0A5B7IDY2_PORTR|nr:hypothetical protein [Portunus trituberculatus]
MSRSPREHPANSHYYASDPDSLWFDSRGSQVSVLTGESEGALCLHQVPAFLVPCVGFCSYTALH